MASACSIKVRGVVQGVGFRPFVYRLACANTLAGWVLNGEEGVEIFVEGADNGVKAFVEELTAAPPSAAHITEIEVESSPPVGCNSFTIRESRRNEDDHLTARISPDLPVCEDCLRELSDSADRRHHYPYINCTNCGPRYSVILALPYDRPNTTMRLWPLDEYCSSEYHDPDNRRFHAQPVACSGCGPAYYLRQVKQPHQAAKQAFPLPRRCWRRRYPRRKRTWWLPSRVRRKERFGCARAPQSKISQREAVCIDGEKSGHRQNPCQRIRRDGDIAHFLGAADRARLSEGESAGSRAGQ